VKLIANGVNREYLVNILELADREFRRDGGNVTERVDAAVAYASDVSLVFDWCWKRKIPLKFWGRFDEEGIPVSLPVLRTFLEHRSANYSCKLLRHFHSKVIWWRGFGAYIGSANLTQKAWFNNFEAGLFLDEGELITSGCYEELDQFFRGVDERSSPLTSEIFKHLELRSKLLDGIRKETTDRVALFGDSDYVQRWNGFGYLKHSDNFRRDAFLKEWMSTIQTIRDIAATVSLDKNRPVWVNNSSPSGTQADQFLHAHYYQRTFDGRRADFESHYEKNKVNPQKAVDDAVIWWSKLPAAPNEEDRMLNEWAPFLKEMLGPDRIHKINEADLVQIMSKIHAAIEYARRVPNVAVGLPGGRQYSMEEKINALAKEIFRRPSAGGPTAAETWSYVLYDGPSDELPSRMWVALHDPKYRIENFGISAMGELVGWALPEKFPPRNGRTSKALRSLGYDVTVHV
jgi:hypothetical protein